MDPCRLLTLRRWQLFMLLPLLFVLLMPSLQALLSLPDSACPPIDALLLACAALFAVDATISARYLPGYGVLEVRAANGLEKGPQGIEIRSQNF